MAADQETASKTPPGRGEQGTGTVSLTSQGSLTPDAPLAVLKREGSLCCPECLGTLDLAPESEEGVCGWCGCEWGSEGDVVLNQDWENVPLKPGDGAIYTDASAWSAEDRAYIHRRSSVRISREEREYLRNLKETSDAERA